MWTYRCYDDGKMPDLWRRWYDAHPDGQGSHDTVFDVLEQLVQWREPHTKILDKNADVIEVRLSGKDKIEYRILGFYGKTKEEFIVLATCYKKGSVYKPKGILGTAKNRKKDILANLGKAPSCARPI